MGGRIRRLLGKLKGTPPLLTTEELIRLLLDREARPSDRGDAAIELGRHDDPEVEDALLGIVRDPGSSAELTEDCGLSLAEIWRSVLKNRRPDWMDSLIQLGPPRK
jgi:hypothetical protein